MLGSDWSTYELEDIVWDEFGKGDDHIVPHPDSGQEEDASNAHCTKKPHLEITISTGRDGAEINNGNVNAVDAKNGNRTYSDTKRGPPSPAVENGHWTETVLTVPYNSECVNEVEVLAKAENKFLHSEETIDGAFISEFSNDDSILKVQNTANYGDLCCFSLGDISPQETDLELFASELEDKESTNFLGYGWPNIGNFDDVDKIFRNCDATFGQQSADNVDDQNWTSSSSPATGGTDVAKSVFGSSDFDRFPMKREIHDADNQAQTNFNSYEETFNGNSGKVKKCIHGGKVGAQRTLSECQSRPDGKRKHISLEHASVSSSHVNGPVKQSLGPSHSLPLKFHPYPPLVKAREMQPWRYDSFAYMDTTLPYLHLGYNCGHQGPVVPGLSYIKPEGQSNVSVSSNASTSNHRKPLHSPRDTVPKPPGMTPMEKIEKLRRRQRMRAALSMMQQQKELVCQTTIDQSPGQRKKAQEVYVEVRDQAKVETHGLENAAIEIDSGTQECSCMSSLLSNETSVEETCLRQLQDVISQLSNATKLCIRDSLHRLAKSATQRHNVGDSRSCSKSSQDKSDNLCTGVSATAERLQSGRCQGLINMETVTNPIDRAVADMLFQKPNDISRQLTDGGPLESHIMANIHKSLFPRACGNCSCQNNQAANNACEALGGPVHHLNSQSLAAKEQTNPKS